MLALEVEFLTGRYVATAFNDRASAEWPPHPSRLFSAFVATWAEADGTTEEASALRWLEAQPAPRIVASEASPRTAVRSYVPVNDLQAVSEPDRERSALLEAEKQLAAVEPDDAKALQQATRAVMKARKKLAAATQKATRRGQKITADGLKAAQAVLPTSRMRQPRTFPSVTPDDPSVVFLWPRDPDPDVLEPLGRLCARIVRLGHASSLVRAAVRTVERIPPNRQIFVPDDTGTETIRVPQTGQLDQLERAWEQHQGFEMRVLPRRDVRYRIDSGDRATGAVSSCFGRDWVVFERTGGNRIPMVRTADLATALRGGMLKHAETPIPALLSGHEDDGTKLERPHVAFVPLPYVGSRYANGDVLGVALVMPRTANDGERRAVLRCIGRWEESERREASKRTVDGVTPTLTLTLGRYGKLEVRRIDFGLSRRGTLRPRTWCNPSRFWSTATPVALDRNPGDLHAADGRKRAAAFARAEATVSAACEHIELPRPSHVEVLRSVVLAGTPKPRSFPPFPRNSAHHRRVLVHARLVFPTEVEGPVIIGAGRYFGMGLCRPIRTGDIS